MRKILALVAAVLAAFAFTPAQAADVKVLAIDTSEFDTPILSAISGIAVTEISPADFANVDLSAYEVLYVGSTFQDGQVQIPSRDAMAALLARKTDIAAFLNSGRGIVALSEPIGDGPYAWAPTPVVSDGYWYGDNPVEILEPTHPVMAGLTNDLLSGWVSSFHTVFSDTGTLTVLANGFDSRFQQWRPLTLAGSFGDGRILLTGQDPDFHSPSGAVAFVQNAIDWVAPPDADNDQHRAPYDDCDDSNDGVYFGATEIKSDLIDQDCNGYDLTISITRAAYSKSKRTLTVEATSALNSGAALRLVGYGPMTWNRKLLKWTATVANAAISCPFQVTVSGVEGQDSANGTCGK